MIKNKCKTATMCALALCVSMLFLCTTVQSANFKKEERTVSSFHEIQVSSAIDLVLTQAASHKVEVESHPDFLSKVITKVVNGELIVRINPLTLGSSSKHVRVFVSIPNLSELEVSGASKVTSTNVLKSVDLDLNISGASSVNLTLEVGKLDVDASGACKIALKGKAREASFDVKGATKLDAFGFDVERVDVEATGASKIEVSASKELSVEASGASIIKYKGKPMIMKQEMRGASMVKQVK